MLLQLISVGDKLIVRFNKKNTFKIHLKIKIDFNFKEKYIETGLHVVKSNFKDNVLLLILHIEKICLYV